MRVPLYEVVPLDLIMGHCWVLDLNTYCKGRPVGAPEEHVYICEYRVDKSAHLFSKIAKLRHSICTKTYAFETFDTRLNPKRTYTVSEMCYNGMPHGNFSKKLEEVYYLFMSSVIKHVIQHFGSFPSNFVLNGSIINE